MTMYRPAPPPRSLLEDVVSADFNRRFDACVTASAMVWSRGLACCATVQERDDWIQAYDEHLAWVRRALSNRRTWGLPAPGGDPDGLVSSGAATPDPGR